MILSDAWSSPFDWSKKPFTYHYSQPKEYHYSLDSIELMWRLSQDLKSDHRLSSDARVLDLCSGCGVLGFELFYCFPYLKQIDFVEVQNVFAEHFHENLRRANATHNDFRFLNMNFSSIPGQSEFLERYQLIVCNPPYFRAESAILGASQLRNRCHFLLDASFEKLCESIRWCLSPKGEAYVLLRDLSEQGIDQFAQMKACFKSSSFHTEMVGEVRGTSVVRVRA